MTMTIFRRAVPAWRSPRALLHPRARTSTRYGASALLTGITAVAQFSGRGDGIRVLVGSAVEMLAVVGTIPGVVPLAAAARCGPGTGSLVWTPSPPTLQFQAPGSSSLGAPMAIPADGVYLLEDGAEPSRWLRVQVVSAWLPSTPAQAHVYLEDRFNQIGPSDVTAAQASSGAALVFTLTLANVSPDQVTTVHAWLDPSASGLAISVDGINWKTPRSETDPNVLAWASIASGSSVALYVRRTTSAGASPSAAMLNLIQLAWSGL